MDQAPLTITGHSPLELVQQLFVKIGARYIVVVNSDGYCEWLFIRHVRCARIDWMGS